MKFLIVSLIALQVLYCKAETSEQRGLLGLGLPTSFLPGSGSSIIPITTFSTPSIPAPIPLVTPIAGAVTTFGLTLEDQNKFCFFANYTLYFILLFQSPTPIPIPPEFYPLLDFCILITFFFLNFLTGNKVNFGLLNNVCDDPTRIALLYAIYSYFGKYCFGPSSLPIPGGTPNITTPGGVTPDLTALPFLSSFSFPFFNPFTFLPFSPFGK